jgi:hypothetical protein
MTRARALDLLLAACAIGMLILAFVVDFGHDGELTLAGRELGAGCVFRASTGAQCPFCGISRSFVSLADGDLASSITHHLLGPVVATSFAAFITAVFITTWRRRKPVIERRVFAVICCALAVAGLSLWTVSGFSAPPPPGAHHSHVACGDQ